MHPHSNRTWSNYTNCVDWNDLNFRLIINWLTIIQTIPLPSQNDSELPLSAGPESLHRPPVDLLQYLHLLPLPEVGPGDDAQQPLPVPAGQQPGLAGLALLCPGQASHLGRQLTLVQVSKTT